MALFLNYRKLGRAPVECSFNIGWLLMFKANELHADRPAENTRSETSKVSTYILSLATHVDTHDRSKSGYVQMHHAAAATHMQAAEITWLS